MNLADCDVIMNSDDCLAVADYLKNNVQRLGRPNVEPFFSHRNISLDQIDDQRVRDIVCKARRHFPDRYNLHRSPKIWPDYTDLVLWREGMDMNVHTDNRPPHFEHRQYSSVIFLNECEGGELHFPDKELVYRTKRGGMVAFESGVRHGVTKITKGMRFTLATWYTSDQSKWEEPIDEISDEELQLHWRQVQ